MYIIMLKWRSVYMYTGLHWTDDWHVPIIGWLRGQWPLNSLCVNNETLLRWSPHHQNSIHSKLPNLMYTFIQVLKAYSIHHYDCFHTMAKCAFWILIRNAHFELKFERRYFRPCVCQITSRNVIWNAHLKSRSRGVFQLRFSQITQQNLCMNDLTSKSCFGGRS